MFTDGSSRTLYDGLRQGGVGVVVVWNWDDSDLCEIQTCLSLPVTGASSQVAELNAVTCGLYHISALQIARGLQRFYPVEIVSDSSYVVDGWNSYLSGWIAKRWIKSDGKPVANIEHWADLIAQTDYYARHHGTIKFSKVTAHQKGAGATPATRFNSQCNEMADQLAGVASRFVLKG